MLYTLHSADRTKVPCENLQTWTPVMKSEIFGAEVLLGVLCYLPLPLVLQCLLHLFNADYAMQLQYLMTIMTAVQLHQIWHPSRHLIPQQGQKTLSFFHGCLQQL